MQKVCFLNIGNFANFAYRRGLRVESNTLSFIFEVIPT
jgi:hypothetical protein